MKTNMGTGDKAFRLLFAALIIILYFMGILHGVLAISAFVVAGIFIVTGFVGYCPLYGIFGMRTNKNARHGA